MLVNRSLEDFVTWVDTSAKKRTIMKYNDEVSSLDLLITKRRS
jgi:U3 small nucleolar ribonucleoprotein protein IMP3